MARKARRPSRNAPSLQAVVEEAPSADPAALGAGQNDELGEPISGRELAKHLDLNAPRISTLTSEGVLPRNRDGTYPRDACRVAYIRSLRRAASNRVKVVSGGDALRDAKLLQMQMNLQERQGKLVQVEDVEALLTEAFGKLRSEFGGIAASVTRDLQLRVAIDEKINDAIDRVRAALEASAEAGFSDSEDNVEDAEATA